MNAINTFTSGMNKDLDKSLMKPSHYLNAENFRLITDGGLSTQALENVKGNTLSVQIPNISNMYIGKLHIEDRGRQIFAWFNFKVISGNVAKSATYNVGSEPFAEWFSREFRDPTSANYISGLEFVEYNGSICVYSLSKTLYFEVTHNSENLVTNYFDVVPAQHKPKIIGRENIRDKIILFTTTCESSDASSINSNGYGQIWLLSYDKDNNPTLELKYDNMLSFSTHNLIKAKSRHETEQIGKVYWCDEFNILRFANVYDQYLLFKEPSLLDIIPGISFSEPIVKLVANGGNYLAGMVQYAYCLYNKNEQITKFSNTTGLIHLTEKSETLLKTNTTPYYGGSELNENTGKSVTVSIHNIDTDYYGIKVAAIFYTTLDSEPIINIVYDGAIPKRGALTIVDNGLDSYGTLTIDEFNLLNTTYIIPKAIESKNDYLFVANIKEKQFDIEFDARAYRFLQNSNTTYVPIDLSETTDWAVGEKLDCINPQQSTYPTATAYSYQKNSSILGGTGPNVSYSFKLKPFHGDSNENTRLLGTYNSGTTNSDIVINDVSYPNKSFDNYASPYIHSFMEGYQRGETYRFGIVFFDKKGLQSYVHWIADIKMPEIYDIDGKITYNINGVNKYDFSTCVFNNTYGFIQFMTLYPEFTIDFSHVSQSIKDQISSFKIVRVKREHKDKTILLQGFFDSIQYEDNDNIKYPGMHPFNISEFAFRSPLTSIQSPEISFFGSEFSSSNSDKIEIIGTYDINEVNNDLPQADREWVYKSKSVSPLTGIDHSKVERIVFDSKVFGVGYGYVGNIGINSYRNYFTGPTSDSYSGTKLVINLLNDCDFSELLPTRASHYALANYKRSVVQYGGNDYYSRINNVYINCGNCIYVDSDTSYIYSCFGGDTFVTYFDNLRTSWDTTPDKSGQVIQYFPVESSINCELRHDKCYSRGGNTYMLQETVALGKQLFPNDYGSDMTDLYLYNSVYSQQNTINRYIPKPLDVKTENSYDTMIRVSNKKFNGELSDNWIVFNPNDFKYVDAEYGAINDLVKYKDYLLYWQDHAFGIQSVLPRSAVQDNNTSSLRIGTGDILDRHDYYSTNFGCRGKFNVTLSRDAIAWYDTSMNKFIYFKGEEVPLSDIKGMQSFFNNKLFGDIKYLDNPITSSSCIGSYDNRYSEFLFTFTDSDNSVSSEYTLAYNEYIGAFTSFYSFIPCWYIKTNDKLLTVPKDDPTKIYIQNNGDYGKFYYELYNKVYDSTLDIIVNDNYKEQKIFDGIKFISEATINGVDLLKETINQIRCYNGYQNSDWYNTVYYNGLSTPLATNELYSTRRETSWAIALPRNAVLLNITSDPDIFNTSNLDQTRPFRERMRDNYIIMNLVYNNYSPLIDKSNIRFVLPYIETTYRLSER